jgi:hypothetical protein
MVLRQVFKVAADLGRPQMNEPKIRGHTAVEACCCIQMGFMVKLSVMCSS